jgi:NADH dehydrogenase (ubiquinone) 1 alpha subcomplex subunit 13
LAESDRDVYRRDYAALEREKEIMKDVEGWEVSFLSPSY